MYLHKSIFTTEITHESSKVNKSWRDKWGKSTTCGKLIQVRGVKEMLLLDIQNYAGHSLAFSMLRSECACELFQWSPVFSHCKHRRNLRNLKNELFKLLIVCSSVSVGMLV